jgi:hypothetical protein
MEKMEKGEKFTLAAIVAFVFAILTVGLINAWFSWGTMHAARDTAATLHSLEQGARAKPESVSCQVPDGDGGTRPVLLGVPEACPAAADGRPSLGQCIRGVPLSEWEARCKAGKV